MNNSSKKRAVLLLSDGTLFEGKSFGYEGTVVGEVVFNTGMTGYQEVITDPSYMGQLVAFTYPELGNTGVNSNDNESSIPFLKGVISRRVTYKPSSWRCEKSINDWLVEHKVVGISEIDTRALVRHLRELGAMNGVISNDLSSVPDLYKELKKAPLMEGLNLAEQVTTESSYVWNDSCLVDFDIRGKEKRNTPYKVVAIDFGIKKSILQRLVAHGCEVNVLPANSDLETVLAFKPEGVFLSNGPGDPAAVTEGISLAKKLIEQNDLPLFGICLGHQILGLAMGGKTYKLPYGHRGLNHPCGMTGKVEITSQNHGFALDPYSLPDHLADITHLNLNDRTVAAFAFRERPIFGVQYHPEASPGPHDADYHFARFVALMAERR